MWSILKREVKNDLKNPLFWFGVAIGVLIIFLNVSPYLKIHYFEEGETIVDEEPETYGDRDVIHGYVPTEGNVGGTDTGNLDFRIPDGQ